MYAASIQTTIAESESQMSDAVAVPALRSDVSPNMSPDERWPTTTDVVAGPEPDWFFSWSSTRSEPWRIWKSAAVSCPSCST